MSSTAKVTFVLGGARSGKSRYAESVIAALPKPWEPPWLYVATAEAGDTEMAVRIDAHRKRRGMQWRTVEAPHNLVAVLQNNATTPILVDCLTLWLSNLMLAGIDIEAETVHLEKAFAAASAPVVLVANEVGYGIVPDHPLGRRFRDLQGVLNQRIAACANCVVLVVAGIPVALKGAL
jgi:adenosylcobinamide kinase / adenosylcobinamide-phosphate guanylyltransferase